MTTTAEVAQQSDTSYRRGALWLSVSVPDGPVPRLADTDRPGRRGGCPRDLLQRRWIATGVSRQPVFLRLGSADRFSVRDSESRRNVRAGAAIGSCFQGKRAGLPPVLPGGRRGWSEHLVGRLGVWRLAGRRPAHGSTLSSPSSRLARRSFRHLVPPDGMPPYDWRPSTILHCPFDSSHNESWRDWDRQWSRASSRD